MKENKFTRFQFLLPYLKNKYTLTFLGALIWLSFFDRNDFITTWGYHEKLGALRNQKTYYEEEITRYKSDLNNLLTNHETMEKYAREHYYMKKDNEDVFLIVEEKKSK